MLALLLLIAGLASRQSHWDVRQTGLDLVRYIHDGRSIVPVHVLTREQSQNIIAQLGSREHS